MSKFSVVYVKKHPWLFGAIFLVFGVFLWMLLNRGASSGSASVGGTTVVTPGPSDTQVAAGVALQQAQIASNTELGLAQLSIAANAQNIAGQRDLAAMALEANLAQVQADYSLGSATIEASVTALTAQLANNLAITHDNNSFMLNYARDAQDAATAQLMIGANLQEHLGQQQLEAFKFGTAAAVIPTLKKGRRDNAFFALTGTTDYLAGGQPNTSGSLGFGG